MSKLKPYTIGLLCSILFHIPFVYFYFNITLFPLRDIAVTIDPLQVECSLTPLAEKYCATTLKIPPITHPPKDF